MFEESEKFTTFLTNLVNSNTWKYYMIFIIGKLLGSTVLINCFSFYIVLYKHTLTIFLSIVKLEKISISIFVKFYNIYKKLNCKPILTNASFIFKK